MKIELIKKTDIDGYIQYYVEKNGQFVPNTVTSSLEKAQIIYDSIKYGQLQKIEVLISEEI